MGGFGGPFSAQYFRVPAAILRRPAALMRRFVGLFVPVPSTDAVCAGLISSTSRKADMARSIVARCCSSREITLAIRSKQDERPDPQIAQQGGHCYGCFPRNRRDYRFFGIFWIGRSNNRWRCQAMAGAVKRPRAMKSGIAGRRYISRRGMRANNRMFRGISGCPHRRRRSHSASIGGCTGGGYSPLLRI